MWHTTRGGADNATRGERFFPTVPRRGNFSIRFGRLPILQYNGVTHLTIVNMRPTTNTTVFIQTNPRNRTNLIRLNNTTNKSYRQCHVTQTSRRRRFIRYTTSMIIPNKRGLNIMIIRTTSTMRLRYFQRMSVPSTNILNMSEHCRRALTRRRLILRLTNVQIDEGVGTRKPRMANVFRYHLRRNAVGMKRRNVPRPRRLPRNERRVHGTMMFLRPKTINNIITRRQHRRTRLRPTRDRVEHDVMKGATRVNANVGGTTRLRIKRRLSVNRGLYPYKDIIARPSTTMTITTSRTKATMRRHTSTKPRTNGNFTYHANRVTTMRIVRPIVTRPLTIRVIMRTNMIL